MRSSAFGAACGLSSRVLPDTRDPRGDPPTAPVARPPAPDAEARGLRRRLGHEALHVAAASEVVRRNPGTEVAIASGTDVVDEGVQPTLEAALAMANDAILRHAGVTSIRFAMLPGRSVELDIGTGWQARLEGRALPVPWTPPVPWAPAAHRPAHGRGRLVAGSTPEDIAREPGLEAVLRRIDERCPYCRGTHELADVDDADLVYLALGHGLHFPPNTDVAWATDPGGGRC
jgi:hypothetical protein